jgi:hypothetical protein
MKSKSGKTYEEALADLAQAIKDRDETKKLIPFLTPQKAAEANRLLRLLDAKIDEGEAALAVEYEAMQNYNAAVDQQRLQTIEMIDKLERMHKYVLPLPDPEALEKWHLTYDECFNFMRLDAEERGLDNSDCPEKKDFA